MIRFVMCFCSSQAYDGVRPSPGATRGRAGALRGRVRDARGAPHPAGASAHGGAAGPQPPPQRHLLHHQADPAAAGPHVPADRSGRVQLVPGAPQGETESLHFMSGSEQTLGFLSCLWNFEAMQMSDD